MRKNIKNKTAGEKTQMKQGDLLLSKVQKHIARQTLAGAVLLLVGVMVLNVNHRIYAETTNDVTTNVVITAGTIELTNLELALNFSSGEAGTASTENAVHSKLVVHDASAGASVWSLYANANYLTSTAQNIAAANITVYPSIASVYNLGQFNNESNAVGRGADGTNMDGNRKLFNSIHNLPGNFGYNGLLFNLTLGSTLAANTYTGSMTFTLIDDAP